MSIFEPVAPTSGHRRPMRLAILGASGSIGTQALDVCRAHPDKIELVGISVNSSCKAAVRIACEHKVTQVVVSDESRRGDPALDELPRGCMLSFGQEALVELARSDEVDCVLNAVVGIAGIGAGFSALTAGKLITYANKESIVVGGDLLMPLAKPGQLIPVDSEHSAIFQCLVGEGLASVRTLWLTCSGGPFFGMDRSALSKVTAAQALRHPLWAMGPKISIDSATLMNKGLEVLEAHHLFEVGIEHVGVLIHREGRVHSMVEFSDGAIKAQLGPPDMRIPIQYALSYPERWGGAQTSANHCPLGPLSFSEPDEEAFGCLGLARQAGQAGGTLPCVMNAANEVANLAFRQGLCSLLGIEACVRWVMDDCEVERVESLDQLLDVDAWARERARSFFSGRCS